MTTLETEPGFAMLGMSAMLDVDENKLRAALGRRFREASSGHKIVLLTLTKLVQLVEERTLVLIDEPEAHLHPPLVSAFVRAISDVTEHRNGVAVLATHSPVVLQEIPASCVYVLRRAGDYVEAARPEMQTFAEDVGMLTADVFKLEVTTTGYHSLITRAVDNSNSEASAFSLFAGQLGAEGKSLLKAAWRTRG